MPKHKNLTPEQKRLRALMPKLKKWTAKQKRDHQKRYNALSQPITTEQVINASRHLETVSYGSGYCWLYGAKSSGGAGNVYGRMKFNGVWIGPHRFALALKLGVTLWDLEGFWAGHAPIAVCMGGRCCRLDHLHKETPPMGAWQRSRDRREVGIKPERTKEEIRRMVSLMYPRGLTVGQSIPDSITLV
jgi:hypothetical protein